MPGEQQETSASDASVQNNTDVSSLSLPPRRRISLSCKFELLTLVLRYLYTNSICFSTSVMNHDTSPVPNISEGEAEGIYTLSVALKLEPLRKKALHFLEATCTITNISSRTFSAFARENPEVRKVYESYILSHWKEVLWTDEFEKAVASQNDLVEQDRISSKFLELTRRKSQE
jgi:hypothetical protein